MDAFTNIYIYIYIHTHIFVDIHTDICCFSWVTLFYAISTRVILFKAKVSPV